MTAAGQDMKSLLYGCEDDQVHPSFATGGKKSTPTHASVENCTCGLGLGVASTEVPFATMEHDPRKTFEKSYVKKCAKRTVPEKVRPPACVQSLKSACKGRSVALVRSGGVLKELPEKCG